METDLLKRVIEAEKEVRQAVAAEEDDAALCLAHVTEDLRRREAAERKLLDLRFDEELDRLRRQAQQEADDRLRRTEGLCARIRAIDEAAVIAVVRHHLRDILP
ncbi:MAG: hypothetical protein AB1568_07005 [Thermodesulfobacteriota bacterium]